ncbi:Dabb family protein [Castellaniella sp.]|uniref:Dabb family protein n=1 Tax=Castellaniella sp. TaxID=1955812 RepID=UPI002AFE75FF|nr:Dabb family protein [Castellaniella sp.]
MSGSGAFLHVVMMRFGEGADARFHHQVRVHAQKVRDECAGILMYHYGENVADRSKGYTHATSALFVDAKAHDVYQTSPAHVAMKQYMMSHIKDMVVYDGLLPSQAG